MDLLQRIYNTVWGVPALILILGVGLYLTVRTRGIQLRLLPEALRNFLSRLFQPKTESGVSSFQAVCTALAATVGTGNLAGVAGALTIGGPGAIFWMWICGLLGMVIKFAEATLAVRYRVKNDRGEWVGGPMYMIRQGLPAWLRPLAGIYCFFGVVAALGVGNATQINTVIVSLRDVLQSFHVPLLLWEKWVLGGVLAVVTGILLSGGARRIGRTAEKLIPFASGVYLLLCLLVLVFRATEIPEAFRLIVHGAFAPRAVTGGILGSMLAPLRTGISRGVFTNEAGMGTASIAHASAAVDHPVKQGMMGIVEVFLDTIVICTMTALVILCSGIFVPYGTDAGIGLTTEAFSSVLGNWVGIVITGALCLFAFATVLGWGLYGLRCAQYLLGQQVCKVFILFQMVTAVLGAVANAQIIWLLAEIVNGLMTIPNLIALWLLTPELLRVIQQYKGGQYENFHQCKPL